MAAVAECLQAFRGQKLTDDDFERPGERLKALATFDVDESLRVVDLDDAAALVKRRLRPSHVATRRREVAQKIAVTIFKEGAAGIGWWSVLDADWAHVTLFHERALKHVTLTGRPEPLSIDLPVVRHAAAQLGVRC